MTSDTPGAAPAPAPDDRPAGGRVPIAERAARRQYLEQHGYDSPQGLATFLRGDREAATLRRSRWDLVFHPVARRIVLAFLAVVAAYLVVSFVAAQLREGRIDTWTGPAGADPAVQSGMRLESCAALRRADDPVFPNWIRFDGRLFQPAGAQLPIGSTNIGSYYFDSGYTLGALRIYRVDYEPLGERGTRILVNSSGSPAGALYGVIEGCR